MGKVSSRKSEIWKPVFGHKGYEVSSHGRVRSIDRLVTRKHPTKNTEYTITQKGKVLQPTDNGKGYQTVCLSVKGKVKRKTVHSLVLRAFVGPRPNDCETRHLDNDRANNALDNVCYGTGRENNYIDKHRHGTIRLGEDHGLAKLNRRAVKFIRDKFSLGSSRYGYKALGNKYRVCSATIRDVVEFRTWSHV